MEVSTLRSLGEVQALSHDWDALHRDTGNENPFLTPGWTLAWLEAMQDKPFVLVARDGNHVVGIMPLCISNRRLMFVEGDAYGFVGRRDGLAEAFVDQLIAVSRDWDVGVFTELLDQADTTSKLAQACTLRGLGWRALPTSTFPFVDLTIDAASYDKKVGKKVINEVNRRRRQLEDLGPLRFVHATTERDVEAYFGAIVELHRRRWADRTDSSAFIDERRTRAMRDAAVRFARAGEMSLELLLLEDRLIAFSYGFNVAGRHVYYSPAFDPAFASYSVSKILLQWQLAECRRLGLREFDFSRGEEPYKLVWATGTRKASTVVLSHRGARSSALAALHERKIQSRAWLRGQPRLVHFRRVTLGRVRHTIEPTTVSASARALAGGLRRSLVDRGSVGTARRVIERALTPIHARIDARLYALPLPSPSPPPLADSTFGVLRGRELLQLADGGRYELGQVVRAYYAGARCYATRVRGEIASYAWVSVGRTVYVPEIERELVVGQDQAYLFDCYTLPAFRGRGLYPHVLMSVAGLLDKKVRSLFILVEADNPRSIRGIENAGFTLITTFDEERWGKRRASPPLPLPSVARSL